MWSFGLNADHLRRLKSMDIKERVDLKKGDFQRKIPISPTPYPRNDDLRRSSSIAHREDILMILDFVICPLEVSYHFSSFSHW